jgi:hypothetical protein
MSNLGRLDGARQEVRLRILYFSSVASGGPTKPDMPHQKAPIYGHKWHQEIIP